MTSYGWRYALRDYSSETFPDWESALHDLEVRFPGSARYAGDLLFLEPFEGRKAQLAVVDADAPKIERLFSVRVGTEGAQDSELSR
jgi:hypothetical protein